MFLHGGIFVIEVFSYTILDETCSSTGVLLIAVVTCVFVDDVSSFKYKLVVEMGHFSLVHVLSVVL